MDKRCLLLLTFAVLAAIQPLEGCSPKSASAPPTPEVAPASPPIAKGSNPEPPPPPPPPPPAPTQEQQASAPNHVDEHHHHKAKKKVSGGEESVLPAPVPAPVPAGTGATSAKPYPHVDAIFYAETPETVGQEAEVCLEVLPPNVSASSVASANLQCKPESQDSHMTSPSPLSKDEGTPGVDTSEYMKATLEFDSEDFEVQNPSLFMHFANPGQHKSFEFKVVPKRIGERQLSVRLFTTDANGNAVDDIFDGRSTVHVKVGRDPVTYLDWVLDHWEALTGIGAALLAIWAWIRKPFGWFENRRAGAPRGGDGNAGNDGMG